MHKRVRSYLCVKLLHVLDVDDLVQDGIYARFGLKYGGHLLFHCQTLSLRVQVIQQGLVHTVINDALLSVHLLFRNVFLFNKFT